jgi:hypothetical protein
MRLAMRGLDYGVEDDRWTPLKRRELVCYGSDYRCVAEHAYFYRVDGVGVEERRELFCDPVRVDGLDLFNAMGVLYSQRRNDRHAVDPVGVKGLQIGL